MYRALWISLGCRINWQCVPTKYFLSDRNRWFQLTQVQECLCVSSCALSIVLWMMYNRVKSKVPSKAQNKC